ncbi:RNA polymerase sigma factor [Frateuria aurantia]|uniref:RNA polymerase sigma factor, sigma-70 family n=1 Tax=Frateuria aurantia (strain ATCC 33424 / DSM 6220 / KCTC 2777 / LMG 1558 / NBRC 3245 / NCIMB 13370) TaxID=767434 RepID=H8L0E8_FRAAD|nr:RNA polymerase sigma factor [Frateuria aurantia]AFC87443.1 RNA polymerase sigma factor, sigma-70 family [Frateuria aurantia DSM 6220]
MMESTPTRPPASEGAALLVSRYAELHRFALGRTGSRHVADEVMQEAWLRLTATPASGQRPRPPIKHALAYVYQVITHLCIDRCRQRQRWQCRHCQECLAEQMASQAPTPFQIAAAQQEYAQLLQAVRQLPPRCRQVFLLYRGQQLSTGDIADRLGLAPKTVEHHIARAVQSCRRHLQDHGHALRRGDVHRAMLPAKAGSADRGRSASREGHGRISDL